MPSDRESRIELNIERSLQRASKIDGQYRQKKNNASMLVLKNLKEHQHRRNVSQSVILAREMTIIEGHETP